jgi:hypothetical protein
MRLDTGSMVVTGEGQFEQTVGFGFVFGLPAARRLLWWLSTFRHRLSRIPA